MEKRFMSRFAQQVLLFGLAFCQVTSTDVFAMNQDGGGDEEVLYQLLAGRNVFFEADAASFALLRVWNSIDAHASGVITKYVEYSIAKVKSHPVNAIAPPLQARLIITDIVGTVDSAKA